MSVGASLIKSILLSGGQSAIREIDPQMLKPEDEVPLYEFVRNHLTQFGGLPSIEIVQAAGHQLPIRVMDTVAFYQNEVRKRHAHSAMSSRLESYVGKLRANEPAAALEILKETILAATPALGVKNFSSIAVQAERVRLDYEFAKANPGLRGVTLGWPTADELTSGGQGGDLIGLAGRTGQGKTWVMMEMVNAAHAAGYVPLVVSMEMTLMQMAYRYIGRVSGINPKLIKTGQISSYAEEVLYSVTNGLSVPGEVPLWFMPGDMDKQVSSVGDLMDELNPDVVFIDGAYLLSGKAKQRGYAQKWDELGAVMSELKQLFIRKNRPCVMTVQLNRNVTKKSERKLDTTDVGGSDRMPQDMSVLWGLRQGQAPYQTRRRVMDWVKNREDEARDFAVNYGFSPVNFGEVPLMDEETENTPAADQPAQINMGWAV